jgi:hypothetical protein
VIGIHTKRPIYGGDNMIKKAKLESCEDISLFLNNLSYVFHELRGKTKIQILTNFIDDMTIRLKNYYEGYGNCLSDYLWEFTPSTIYYEDEDTYFKIDFYTGEVKWQEPWSLRG